jgi:hypothetical protein
MWVDVESMHNGLTRRLLGTDAVIAALAESMYMYALGTLQS